LFLLLIIIKKKVLVNKKPHKCGALININFKLVH